MIADKLFHLLRLALKLQTEIDHSFAISAGEWPLLFDMAQKQSLVGVCFAAIELLPKEQRPPKVLLLNWYAMTEQIKERNTLLNEKCHWLTRTMGSIGLDTCILKGQGIAALYPNPLLRQSGDIDVWTKTRVVNFTGDINRGAREIIKRLAAITEGKIGKATYYHVEWDFKDVDVEVEVHYRPQSFNNPFVNKRFQAWCETEWNNRAECDGYYVPSADFNAVYLLAHLYHHLLFEGVGLRQVCDYAMFLQHCDYNHEKALQNVKDFKMLRFARGIMWVVAHIFNISRKRMFVESNEEGRFILFEIMQAGNFGKYDKRINHSLSGSTIGNFYLRTKHRTRFLTRYPSEIVWDIPFRLYHWWWRNTIL